MTALDANTAPIILAGATFVTAVAGAIVLVFNAVRQRRIEGKVDAGAVVQGQIHTAVNSKMQAALDEIVALKAELQRLRTQLPL